jgi:hypothetical protein
MDMIGRIRRLHDRANKSEREIARMTGLLRNTVPSGCTGGGWPAEVSARGVCAQKELKRR